MKRILLFIILFLSVLSFVFSDEARNYLNQILHEQSADLEKNYKRLSGGTFLLPDDPANFAIYQKLETHIRGLSKEIGNNTDVICYYQYVESILGTMIEHLQRIHELLIMRSNGIYSSSDRSMIDSEVTAQYDAILFALKTTEYNKKPVFDSFFRDEAVAQMFSQSKYFQLKNVDTLLKFVIKTRSFYGAKTAQLESRIRSESSERENAQGFQSTIFDLDYASEITELRKNELLFMSTILLLSP